MLKYAKIKGFKNLGEVAPHVYEWVEDIDLSNQMGLVPEIIFINAYEREPIMYKGYVFSNSLEYMPIEPAFEEMEKVTKLIGEVKNIKDFNEFIKITGIDNREYKLDPLYGKRDF